MEKQSGREIALAVSMTRTRHVAVPAYAKFAKVCRRSFFSSQSFQPGTPFLQSTNFQAQPLRRTHRMAVALFRLSTGEFR